MNLGSLLIILAAFLWSLDGLIRQSLYILEPTTIVFLEHLFGLVILAPLFLKTWPELKNLTGKTWLAIGWVSLLSGVLGTLFYTKALAEVKFIQFSVVVLLQQLQPIFEISLAALMLKEVITRRFIIWASGALVGAYLVSFPNLTVNFRQEQPMLLAVLLALAAAFAWGSSTAFSKYGLKQLSFVTMAGIRFLITSIIALGFVFWLGKPEQLGTLSPSQLVRLVVIALSTGMVAIVIYYAGLKRTPVRIAAICELFWPVSAIGIDYLYFHKSLTLTQWLGVLVLLVAITRVSLWRSEEKILRD